MGTRVHDFFFDYAGYLFVHFFGNFSGFSFGFFQGDRLLAIRTFCHFSLLIWNAMSNDFKPLNVARRYRTLLF